MRETATCLICEPSDDVGVFLREVRESLELSQAALAAKCDPPLAHQTLHYAEQPGSNPTISTVRRACSGLSAALGKTVRVVIEEAGEGV